VEPLGDSVIPSTALGSAMAPTILPERLVTTIESDPLLPWLMNTWLSALSTAIW